MHHFEEIYNFAQTTHGEGATKKYKFISAKGFDK